MNKRTAIPQIRTSVLISPEFYKLSKDNNITFSEALRVGISFLLAERGVKDYDNNLNIIRKIEELRKVLEQKSQELENLKGRIKEDTKEDNGFTKV